jgi:hypothetical protein
MKSNHLIKTLLLLVVLALGSSACGSDKAAELTALQKLSRVWRVESAKLNGADFPAGTNFSALRITFTTAGNYSIVRGASPVVPSKAPSLSGTWALNSTATQVTVDGGTANARTIDLSNLSTTTATISWKEDTDKNNPTIIFNLVPVQ